MEVPTVSSRFARRTAPRLFALASLAASVTLVACGGAEPSAPAGGAPATPAASAPATPAAAPTFRPASAPAAAGAAKMAQEIFTSRCVTCHGAKGKGDGPGSVGLVPPPRDLSDAAWQATVTDEYLEKIIAYGGFAVGKSAGMPPNPDLMAKKEVVAELRAMVRALAKN
jgi:mono/diheme cytochrome c family protein